MIFCIYLPLEEVFTIDKKALKRYIKKDPHFKQWIKSNDQWLESNPQALKSLLDNPMALVSVSEMMTKKQGKLNKKLKKLEKRQTTQVTPKKKSSFLQRIIPKLKIPSISSVNEKFTQASQMMDTITGLSSMLNKRPPI